MKRYLIIILSLVFFIIACTKNSENSPSDVSRKSFDGVTVRLAKQYGMQYTPAYVMEKMNLLEKYLPGANIEWSSFGGGAAITEALISGHLDVGFMGMPPAIIAIDKGADLKIATGISVPPNVLMVKEERLQSIADLKAEDKIAVPGIGSIQHILLSIAARDKLDKARNFDTNIITMANPDAYSSLISGTEVVGHFTTMPFIEMETRQGFRSILTGKEAYGDVSIVCVATGKFHSNPTIYSALMGAINEAIDLINQQDSRVIEIISEVENISSEDALAFLNWPGTNYTSNIYGLMGIANYMHEVGYIKNKLELNNLLWENARALIGKRIGEISPIEEVLGQ